MTKLTVSILVSLAIILVFGVVELTIVDRNFSKLKAEVDKLIPRAKEEAITVGDFTPVVSLWQTTRKRSEFFLTHNDLNEVNMRIAECKAFAETGEYSSTHMQLTVLSEILAYIPRTVKVAWRNIV
jgi:di/tricarboxylate transporter